MAFLKSLDLGAIQISEALKRFCEGENLLNLNRPKLRAFLQKFHYSHNPFNQG